MITTNSISAEEFNNLLASEKRSSTIASREEIENQSSKSNGYRSTLKDTAENSASKENNRKVEDSSGASNSNYAGDFKDTTPLLENIPVKISNEIIQIDDPAMLAEIFDPSINEGRVTLYEWQISIAEEFGRIKPTQLSPYKKCICACNGSGKDAYVIAPFAVWFALCKKRSLTIITSSSGVQLTAQTENYIKTLANRVNEYFGQQIFKINQRFIKCLLTGSEIRMFATDEEGKAEGYHPLDAGAEMAIIVNEAKSVRKEIFNALKRCTGFNYWLNVSTPGEPNGEFYKSFTSWSNSVRVDTFMCPAHLSSSERESEKIELGEHSALYRSKHLALFTSIGGQVIIPVELTEELIKNPPEKRFSHWPLRIGGDLAAGGDECVLTGVKGNIISKRVSFTQADTTISSDIIDNLLTNEFKVSKTHEYIYMDDGGVGRGIIDNLRRRGWNIKRILNQSAAVRKQEFGNRGAESWFRAKRILEERLFRLDNDEKFLAQLSNRYYKQQSTQGRITLESKKDAKAHGRPSPDRADSFLLALTGLTIDDFLEEDKDKDKELESKKYVGKTGSVITPENAADFEYEDLDKGNRNGSRLRKKHFNSVSSLLKHFNN